MSEPTAETESGNDPVEEPIARKSLRWWPGAGVIVLGAAALGFAQYRYADEQTWRHAVTMIAAMSTAFFLLLWWVLLSRARWQTRLYSFLAAVGALGLFVLLFQVDELSGSMIPRFRFRWAKTPEQQAVDYFADAESNGVAKPRSDPNDEGTDDEQGLVIGPDDWPGFRGANRDGIVSTPIRTDWNENPPRELWRHPIGVGWSSFAVVDGLAFTQEQRGPEEMVVCYDVETGEQIWAHGDETRFVESQGGDGPRATPTIHDGKLYSLGATGILNCLDALTGEVVWSTDVLEDAETENLIWGMCGSPLVVDDVVIVNPGVNAGVGEYGVVAYDRLNGEVKWTAGDDQAAYAAPRLETLAGLPQVLILDAAGLASHDPKYGTRLWFHPWKTFSDINVAQPIKVDDTHVFVASGYSHGSALIEVTFGKLGWDSAQEWANPRGPKLKFQSGVKKGRYVYGLDDGILSCHDLETGKQMWKGGRYGFGQLLLVGDHVLSTVEETGEVVLVRAHPDSFDEVVRFQALGTEGNQGILWNHPVIWNGRLIVRNAREVACFDVRP